MNSNRVISQKQKQGGYTLVELGIVMAILAVLIVAGLAGVQSILASGKVNAQLKTVAMLGAQLTKSQNGQTNTAGFSAKNLVNLPIWEPGKFSVDAATGAATISSSFGTPEFLGTNGVAIDGMPVNTGFKYTITSVPQNACTDLANGLNSLVYAFAIAKANATPADVAYPTTAANKMKVGGTTNAVDQAALATQCANASTDFVIALKP